MLCSSSHIEIWTLLSRCTFLATPYTLASLNVLSYMFIKGQRLGQNKRVSCVVSTLWVTWMKNRTCLFFKTYLVHSLRVILHKIFTNTYLSTLAWGQVWNILLWHYVSTQNVLDSQPDYFYIDILLFIDYLYIHI